MYGYRVTIVSEMVMKMLRAAVCSFCSLSSFTARSATEITVLTTLCTLGPCYS
jgi:hypothetical protein